MKNKKAVAGVIWLMVFLVFAAVGLLGYAVLKPQIQTGLGGDTSVSGGGVGLSIPCGKDATGDVFVYDYANSDVSTKNPLAFYVIDKGTNSFVADGTTASSSSRTSINTKSCANLQVAAFNNSYYGVLQDVSIGSFQQKDIDVKSYRITNSLEPKFWGNSTSSGEVTGDELGASESKSLNRLEVRLNTTNRAFRLGVIYFDTPASTNMSDILINSPTVSYQSANTRTGLDSVTSVSFNAKNSVNLGRTTNDDIVYELASPITLLSYDKVTFPGITVKADGDGITSTGENVTIYFADKALYRSTQGTAIKEGYENDASTPADVGASDFSVVLAYY